MKKLFSAKYSDNAVSVALFFLRVSAGAMLIPHGYLKIQKFNVFSSQFIDPFGIGTRLSLSLSIFAEFFCAILIIFGLLTRLACIPIIVNMAIAVFIAHHGRVFTENADGEHAALYLAIFLTLLITGPGKFSADRMIGK
jgi:putative oxidoreductase